MGTQSRTAVPRDCELQYGLYGYNMDSYDGGKLVDEIMSFHPDGFLRSKDIIPMDDVYTSTPGGRMVRSCMVEALLDMTHATLSAETKQVIDDHGGYGGHVDYETVDRTLYLLMQAQEITGLIIDTIESTAMGRMTLTQQLRDGFAETISNLYDLRNDLEKKAEAMAEEKAEKEEA